MEYHTSLPLYSWYFNEMKEGRKDLEMRKNKRGIELGHIIRFMKGYNPEYGVIFRRVRDVYSKMTEDLTSREIKRLALDKRKQALDYSEGEVWLFSLEEVHVNG